MDERRPLIEHGAVAIDAAAGSWPSVPSAEIGRRYAGSQDDRRAGEGGHARPDRHPPPLPAEFPQGHAATTWRCWIGSTRCRCPRIKVAVQDYLRGRYGIQHARFPAGVRRRHPGGHHHHPEHGMGDPPLRGRRLRAGRDPGGAHADHDRPVDLARRAAAARPAATRWPTSCWSAAAARPDGRITFRYGLACPNSCSVELIKEVRRQLADRNGVRIHIHIAETQYEWDNIQPAVRRTPTAHLHNLGLLGPDVLGAHCIWLSDEDIELFATDRHEGGSQPRVQHEDRRRGGADPARCSMRAWWCRWARTAAR